MPTLNIGYLFIAAGVVLGALSLDYQNSIISLMATSIVFWGALLVYFKSQKSLDLDVVNSTFYQYYKTISEVVDALGYEGEPFYYSPDNIFGLTNTLLLIPKTQSLHTHTFDEVSTYEGFLIEDNLLLKFIPPGQALSEKIEENINHKFSSIKVSELRVFIEQTIVNNLEVAKTIDFDLNDSAIKVIITGSVFMEMYNDKDVMTSRIGDPLVSALACAISRASRSIVYVDKIFYDNKIIETEFRLLNDWTNIKNEKE